MPDVVNSDRVNGVHIARIASAVKDAMWDRDGLAVGRLTCEAVARAVLAAAGVPELEAENARLRERLHEYVSSVAEWEQRLAPIQAEMEAMEARLTRAEVLIGGWRQRPDVADGYLTPYGYGKKDAYRIAADELAAALAQEEPR